MIGLDLVLQCHSATKVVELLPQWETGPRLDDVSDDDTFERVFGSLNIDVRARPAWTHSTSDEERSSRQKFVFRNSSAYHLATRELLAALLTDRQANAPLVDRVLASIRGAISDKLEQTCVDAVLASYEAASAFKSDRDTSSKLFDVVSEKIADVSALVAKLETASTVDACALRLRSAAVVLERTAPLLVVLCFADDASSKKKKAKGKKGKREKEQEPAWRLALTKSINAFLSLLTALKTSLKKDQLDEDAPAELPEESVLPEDDSRVEVAKLLGTARRVSLDRLLGVCGDKLAALQGRIR